MTQFEAIVRLTENDAKAIKAYSPAYGWLTIKKVNFTEESSYNKIKCETERGYVVYFTRDLRLQGAEEYAGQMLFPNRECESWVVYLNRERPALKFYVDEFIAYVREPNHSLPLESDVFILARIVRILDTQLIVRDNLLSSVRTINLDSAYKLKDAAKILKNKKDVQSI